jgi:hypothetical protein
MKVLFGFFVTALLFAFLSIGCKDASTGTSQAPSSATSITKEDKEAGRQANLAKLGPEDRKLVEEQRFCAVEKNPLGSMGVPVKVLVKDQPVFLCCAACKTKALAHADRTLATVKELKQKSTGTPTP